MYIVYAVDNNYAPYVIPQLFQLKQVGAQFKGIKVIVNPHVTREIRNLIQFTAESYNFKLEIIESNKIENFYTKMQIKNRTHVSYFTYVKLFIPEILPNINEILYLDVDILIRKPIHELLTWKLTHPIGAVPEMGKNGQNVFGTPHISYFNAGILRMSLSKCREMSLAAKARKLIQKDVDFEFQDQDIFNIIFQKKFDHLSPFFNVFHNDAIRNTSIAAFQDPTIVHFNGPEKPWHLEMKSRYANQWRESYSFTKKNLPTVVPEKVTDSPKKIGPTNLPSSQTNFKAPNTKKKLSIKVSYRRSIVLLKIADSISVYRRSTLGTWVRARLPYRVRKNLNRFVYMLYKNFPNVKNDLDAALFLPMVKPDEVPQNIATHQSRKRFVFLISQPRSGTNAFLDLVCGSNESFVRGGEIFTGHHGKEINQIILKKFPWVTDLKNSEDKKKKIRERYQKIMNDQALELLNFLATNEKFQKRIFIVKIFPDHLSLKSLELVLKTHALHIIFLRRRMIYSYISLIKARSTKSWWGIDYSAQKVELDEKRVQNYIDKSNAWFVQTQDLVSSMEVPSIHLTYEEIFEGKDGALILGKFLKNFTGSKILSDPSKIPTLPQDRRHDRFLSEILAEFANIRSDLQAQLLRFPGLK